MSKSKVKILTHKQAKEEEMDYFLSLAPIERFRELNKLRILNYGEKAMAPAIKKVILKFAKKYFGRRGVSNC